MTTKIIIPKCNIKNVDNKVVQANFIKAVSDLVLAETATISAKAMLVNVTLELIGDNTELTFDDRMYIKDMLTLGYQAKYSDDDIAEKRANSQFNKIRKDLEDEHNIVFLDKETKTAKNKAKSRKANEARDNKQIDKVSQIQVANDVETPEAISLLSDNIVESGGTALSDSQQKSLLKKIEEQKFQVPAKRKLIKDSKSGLTFDKDHQEQLKEFPLYNLELIYRISQNTESLQEIILDAVADLGIEKLVIIPKS
jgi:hypothetical protein